MGTGGRWFEGTVCRREERGSQLQYDECQEKRRVSRALCAEPEQALCAEPKELNERAERALCAAARSGAILPRYGPDKQACRDQHQGRFFLFISFLSGFDLCESVCERPRL